MQSRPALFAAVCCIASPSFAQDLCTGLVRDRLDHPMSAAARPPPREAFRDPQFGAVVRRISAVAPVPGGDAALRPLYSTVSAWNADESRLLLYRVGGGHELYDGHNYRFLESLAIAPADVEQVFWDTSDPDLLVYPKARELVRRNVKTRTEQTLRRFDFCSENVTAGPDATFTDWSSSLIGLRCGAVAFLYDISTDQVTGAASTGYAAPQVAPSGQRAILNGVVVDRQLRPLLQLDLANPYEHASPGRRADGGDTLDAVAFDPGPRGSGVGTLVSHDLATGASRVLVGPATGFPYPPSGTHVSSLAWRAPGWSFVSVVGDPSAPGILGSEIVLANSLTGEVCRAAHHRSWGRRNTHLQQPYWAEPHVVASPSGTRAVFASDWGNGLTVDAFVLELPAYQPLRLTASSDATLYRSGSTLRVSLGAENAGAPGAVELLVLFLLPDGDQVVMLTPGGFRAGRLSELAGLVALGGVSLETPFEWADADFLDLPWSPGSTPGSYALLFVAISPGSLADGKVEPLDVRALASRSFVFLP